LAILRPAVSQHSKFELPIDSLVLETETKYRNVKCVTLRMRSHVLQIMLLYRRLSHSLIGWYLLMVH